MQKWLIGVDEAGRGPLAGPVSVGVVLVPANFDWSLIPGVNDSKKLSAKKREIIFERTLELVAAGELWYSVQMPSARAIDSKGIAVVIRSAMTTGLQQVMAKNPRGTLGKKGTSKSTRQDLVLKKAIENWLATDGESTRSCLVPGEVRVLLDGSLYAPAEFVHQETIIKGDAKEKVIGLASIMAKVTRDRYMEKMATRPAYAAYDFVRHKGYGTLAHRTAIATYGLSTLHRETYCRNIVSVV